MRRARLPLRGWVLAVAALCAAGGRARADTEEVARRAVEDLDAPAWTTRRVAEGALEREGEAALVGAMEGGTGRARAAAFSAAVDAGLRSGRPAIECALRRLLVRLEAKGEATDERVRLVPRLLRLRVERLAPQVVERIEEAPFPARGRWPGAARFGIARGDPVAAGSLRGLEPEAHAVLIDVVSTASDARRLAGAVAMLGGETGSGPTDPAAIEAIAAVARRDPALAAEVRFFEAHDRTHPVAHVALALALSGDAGRVPAVLRGAPEVAQGAAVDLVRRRLPALGMGDVAQYDRFLDAAFRGVVSARDAGEAARRALEAGLPWIARLEARRGLFLDGSDAACRAALVASAAALGLGATARAEAQGRVEVPASVPDRDDEAAKAADALLREGSFGRRLVWRVELGHHAATGLVPVAVARGLLAFGNTIGDVAIVPAATAQRMLHAYSTSRGIPRSVALSGPFAAAVSWRGDLVTWRVGRDEMVFVRSTGREGKRGPYVAVTAAKSEGDFVVAGEDGRLHLLTGGEEPVPLAAPPGPEKPPPESLALLEDGSALLGRGTLVQRIDLRTGARTTLVDGDAAVAVAPYGSEVLVARAGAWERRGPDGAVRASHESPTGDPLVGIAGDPAAGLVYLASLDRVTAVGADDGTTRWAESIEASGNPVLGAGLLIVPAGRGPGADGRRARTLTALRPGPPGFDPFDEISRRKVVEVAKAAQRDGRDAVASLLLDVVLDSFPEAERLEIERAVLPRPSDATPPADDGEPEEEK